MRYLPPTLADLKNRQDVEPRTGIDLIAIKKYLTYQEPFYSKLTDGIEGEVFAGNLDKFVPTSWVAGYYDYDGFDYYLINDDASEAYLIDNITSTCPDEWIQTTTNMSEDTSVTYYIAKYYQSRLDSAPTIDSSMEVTGALMQTGNCQFDIANPEEDTFSSGSYNYLAANTLELGSGDALSLDYIGRIARIAHSGGYELDTVITDVDLGTDTITVCDTIRYYVDESYQVSIILQTFFSDIFRTTPNIEDTQCLIRQYLGDNQDVFYETNSIILMDGKIKSIGDLTQESIPVTVYDEEKYLEENKIGNLITEDDGYMVSGTPVESIGMMKPIVFGTNDYSQQTTNNEQATQKNNLCKMVYLGVDKNSGKRRYLLSADTLYAVNDMYMKNEVGRLNKLSSSQWSIASVSGDEIVIEINSDNKNGTITAIVDAGGGNITVTSVAHNLSVDDEITIIGCTDNAYNGIFTVLTIPTANTFTITATYTATDTGTWTKITLTFTDFWYGNETGTEITKLGSVTGTTLGDAANNDASDNALIAMLTTSANAEYEFDVNFNAWDMDSIKDANISSVKVFSTYLHSPTSYAAAALKINGSNALELFTKFNEQFAIETSDQAGIVDNVPVNFKASYTPAESVEDDAYIYLVYKEITYNKTIAADTTPEIYADCDGMEYGTWINNRGVNDTDENGGFFQYENADNDDATDMIENPVGVIEAILRSTVFAGGLINSQIDMDSFNRASIARAGWKFSTQITEQTDTVTLLQKIMHEHCLVLGESPEGLTRIFAYDPTAPFTNNNIIFNGATNYISLDVPITISTGRYFIWYGMSSDYATSYQGIVGRSLGAYSYIRFDNPAATKILGETDTDSDLLNWTITSIDDGVFHKIKVINNGSNIYELFLDDVSQGTSTGSTSADVITIDRVGQGRAGTDLLDGKIGYFQVFEDDDSVMIDIKSINEISIDTTGDYKLTETGTFTYELSKEGIYDYHSGISDGEYLHLPIIAGLPKFPKVNTDLFTTLIQNYNKSNISGKYQDTDTDTDTTYVSRAITKEVNLDFISDTTTIEARATLMLILFSRLRRMIEFNSSVASIHHEKGDIVNVWSPVLNNGIYSTSAMKAKKWIVLSKTFDTQMQKYNLIGCELLS